MMPEIDKIACALGELLKEKEIIARCELLLRTYDIVRTASLSDQGYQDLYKMVGKNTAPGIFASIMSKEPIFSDLPRVDTYTQIDGRIFHFLHTKKYSKQDFDNANRRLQQSLPELKAILARTLGDLLKNFLDAAGYRLSLESKQELIFTSGERNLLAYVVTSLKGIDIDKCKPKQGMDSVILVPSSESLEPFMQFYKEKGEDAEKEGIQIWVANIEKGIIDPFIGYTTDLDIYNQFDNPRLAEMVRNNWAKRNSALEDYSPTS
jgi:hypothetical protein